MIELERRKRMKPKTHYETKTGKLRKMPPLSYQQWAVLAAIKSGTTGRIVREEQRLAWRQVVKWFYVTDGIARPATSSIVSLMKRRLIFRVPKKWFDITEAAEAMLKEKGV
jgi:hypothetical protein